ncbi:MAG TPA: SDR family NAD(P)-dependent oxidoreductase [Planctomycetota bacterium]
MIAFPDRYGPWALVTGASSGIGRALAVAAAERGLAVAMVARRADRIVELAARLEGQGHQALAVPLDLLATDALEQLRVALGTRAVGLLVNNAGFGWNGSFHQADARVQREMVRLNCELPVALASVFLPPMVARGRGGVITVASTSAYQPTPWMATYGATKAFALHFSEALSVELEGTGVAALAVSPGHTSTEFHAIAGTHGPATGGGAASAEDVAGAALDRLGRRPSFVHGFKNALFSHGRRVLSRPRMARTAGRILGRRLRRFAAEAGQEPRG